MLKLEAYRSATTANGTYCVISANSTLGISGAAAISTGSQITSATLLCNAGAGVNGGVVVPVILALDGNYYPIQASSTLSAAGFVFSVAVNSPCKGVAIQITTPVTGGTIFLYASALIV